ncbi:hypothetical protein HDU76_006361 [Blyttiomyces sp. JEL0837]|nr:hypothetical protein HDU76_006361 [Blyttiomyces sp. JEL0837]
MKLFRCFNITISFRNWDFVSKSSLSDVILSSMYPKFGSKIKFSKKSGVSLIERPTTFKRRQHWYYGHYTKKALDIIMNLYEVEEVVQMAMLAKSLFNKHPDILKGLLDLPADGRVGDKVDIRTKSIFYLLPDVWVDDQVIRALMSNCLGNDARITHVMDTMIVECMAWGNFSAGFEMPTSTCGKILLPLNLQGYHWLLIVVDLVNGKISLGDSIPHGRKLPESVQMNILNWVRVHYDPKGYPVQKYSVSCGMITVAVGEMLSRGIDFTGWKWSKKKFDR